MGSGHAFHGCHGDILATGPNGSICSSPDFRKMIQNEKKCKANSGVIKFEEEKKKCLSKMNKEKWNQKG